ncbi:MAG TPA: hypothetical protein VF728_07515 [Nocardioides sp.]
MIQVDRRVLLLVTGSGLVTTLVTGRALLTGPLGPTRGAGVTTSFGSIVLLGWAYEALAPGSAAHGSGDPVGRGGHPAGAVRDRAPRPVPSAVHGAWTDAVAVELEVHNGSRAPLVLSPGQFLVRVQRGGPTVALYSADHGGEPVAPGTSTRMQIRYLVPPPDREVSLEYVGSVGRRPLRIGTLERPGAVRS